MLSWEYPPVVVGGIARHVHDLSTFLAARGVEVSVLTMGRGETPPVEKEGMLTVYRARQGNPSAPDLISQVMQLNLCLMEKAVSLAAAGIEFDLVHAHDWVTAYAGKALKHGLGRPLIGTVHATEHGRNCGLHNDLQRYISSAEWWLIYESWRVICCSKYMRGELQHVFQTPADKIDLIPNGVIQEEFMAGAIPPDFRSRYAAPDEKIILYVGRLVREKGLDVLIEAMPIVLARRPATKLIIAGTGPYAEHLQEHARKAGVFDRVYFTGYIDDRSRNLLYRLAAAAVFPSYYEPFGIVALEAMAAGAPPVVSDTGGLSEVVVHGRNGLKSRTGNAFALADSILWLLDHEKAAERMRNQAREDVNQLYNWNDIAADTIRIYRRVLDEYHNQPNAGLQREVVYGTALDGGNDLNRYSRVGVQ